MRPPVCLLSRGGESTWGLGNVRRTCTRGWRREACAALLAVCMVLGAAGTPNSARAATGGASYYSQAQAAARHGDYRTAVTDYEQAILHGHNDPATYYQLGLAFKQTKQLSNAAWAVAKALSDPAFSTSNPSATQELNALEQAGAYDVGPPAAMKNATMTAGTVSPAQAAQQEAQSAYSVFQDPQQAYFVAPGMASRVSVADQGQIVQFANDATDQSNTVVKFVFLDATPAPYTRLTDYAQDLLARLNLPSGIVVVVTPQLAAAASNRLDSGSIANLVAQQLKANSMAMPAQLATGIGRAILNQADDNSRSSTIRSVIGGGFVVLLVLAVLALAIMRIVRRTPSSGQRMQRPQAYASSQKRTR